VTKTERKDSVLLFVLPIGLNMTTKEKWRNSTKKLITLSQIAPIDHIRDGIHKTSQITASTAGMLTAGFLKTETAATRRRYNT